MQVSLRVYRQVHHTMLAYPLKHVVEEAQSSTDVAFARTVEVYLHIDVGLLCLPTDLRNPLSGK